MFRRLSARAVPLVVLLALVCVPAGRAAAQGAAPAAIPTPESVLGFKPGADFHLATYEEALGYFQKLAAVSNRIRLVDIGKTSEGREWYFALISSPQNLANVEHYRDIAQKLAHPTGLTDAEAHALAREGKAFVHIDGGLHSSEVAGGQHTIQLAYDLVAHADDPDVKAMLDNVILMLWPSLNPDGQDTVVRWYRSNLGGPYEVAPLVELYQKYIGHDNNRDAYMLNMVESRVVQRTWRRWEPDIVYVQHQSGPFPTRIWLPPFAEPVGTEAPALMSREVNTIGMAIAQGLEEQGQVGATHMGTGFDAWYPGYIDYMPMFQNIAAFWTETALYRYATPHFYTVSDFPADYRDLRPQSLYSSAWKGGWWRLGDAVAYMVTASKSVVEYAAKYREELLYNRYQAGRDTIARYRVEAPYAYLIPQDQRDPVAPVELLRRLAFVGVRIDQLGAAATIDGVRYPAGTWVIPMDQEFAQLAREVLEVQKYPDLREYPDGPPEQPYDAAGWTLPYQMDVQVAAAATPLPDAVRAALKPVEGTALDWKTTGAAKDAAPFDSVPGIGFNTNAEAAGLVPLPGALKGTGTALAVDPAENNAFRAVNAAWAAGGTVRFEAGKPDGAGGRYVITGVPDATEADWVKSLALRAERTMPAGVVLKQPRIGLYQPWQASIDAGWTEWLLQQYGFTFSNVRNADIAAGRLRDRLDVIVMADARPASILNGWAHGEVPPQYEGGLGPEGVRALDAFVRAGGTLVCLNRSSDFAIEQLHLPVTDVVKGLGPKAFFVTGSLLQVTTDPAHPVMAGMPVTGKIFAEYSPVFTPQAGFEGSVLAKYQTAGSPLMSGYLLGEDHLDGQAAAVDVRLGAGHVILLGFRPQWRDQSFGTFRVLFNAVLFSGDVAAKAAGTPGFWKADSGPDPVKPAKTARKSGPSN
ncbi:MAG: hypothetical protein KGN76_11070 [Acidobacteriota bacterium]|nr:hypothetical protein [Acidobacteriota bacterium]